MLSLTLIGCLAAPPLPVLVIRRTGETGSEIIGRTAQGEFTILRGAVSDAFRAAISPDGTKIAFIAGKALFVAPLRVEAYEGDRGVSARRWVSDARRVRLREWAGAVQLADSATSGPSWSPDGMSLVFTRPHADSGPREQGDIMRVQVRRDGTPGTTSQLTNTTGDRHRDANPAYSPDGSTLLFYRDAEPRSLYTMRSSGGVPTSLGLGIGWDQFSWFPSGGQVVGSRLAGSGAGIFTFGHPKVGTPTQVSYTRASDHFPQVSPDGRNLAFSRPTRITSALTVSKLLIGPLGDEGASIRRAPTMITEAATSRGEVPLQWIALTPPR